MNTTKEKSLCPKCGLSVRQNASFCFKCGTPISREKKIPAEIKIESHETTKSKDMSDVWFKDTLVEDISENQTIYEIDEKVAEIAEPVEVIEQEKPKPKKKTRVWSKKEKVEEPPPPLVMLEESTPPLNTPEVKIEETSVPQKVMSKAEMAEARSNKPQKKVIEIVWEEPESTPTAKFLIITIFFLAIAIGAIVLSFLLK